MLLWVLALLVSALLVLRFHSYGAIAGILTIWATGIMLHAYPSKPRHPDYAPIGEAIWIAGGGGIAGAAWTLPILIAWSWFCRRRRLRTNCRGDRF